MILPPHITRNNKKEILKLFNLVKDKEGIDKALLLKKMATVAAFGTMIMGKINFGTFIEFLKIHLVKNNKPIDTFWNIKILSTTRNTMFFIPYDIVYNGTQNQVEITIGETFTKKIYQFQIKKEFQDYFCKTFRHNNNTV